MHGKNALKNFQPRNQPISRQIADKIQQVVMDGNLLPGDRLPSERQLADDLNVSRNMIREAVALLEERGIVSIQVGSGIYVTEARTDTVTRTLSIYAQRKQVTVAQMFEVRWALEVENARFAATNALPRHLQQLSDALRGMEEHKKNIDEFARIDITFHQILARASQNPLFPVLLDTITDMLYDQAVLATNMPGAAEVALNHHCNIFQAIQNKDADGARAAMCAHLESGWEYLLRAVKNPQETIGVMRFVSYEPEPD